jgi:hypothetical protein
MECCVACGLCRLPASGADTGQCAPVRSATVPLYAEYGEQGADQGLRRVGRAEQTTRLGGVGDKEAS